MDVAVALRGGLSEAQRMRKAASEEEAWEAGRGHGARPPARAAGPERLPRHQSPTFSADGVPVFGPTYGLTGGTQLCAAGPGRRFELGIGAAVSVLSLFLPLALSPSRVCVLRTHALRLCHASDA